MGLLQTSSFEQIQSVINEAMKLGTNTDYGHDFIQDFEDRYQVRARLPSSTGWDEIDSIIRGGLGKRELGVIVAPTGAGKSMALVHLGAEALKQGKTVIHYTLELADTTVGNRYDSCITGIPLKDLHEYKEQILQDIKNIPGTLIIKEYPTGSNVQLLLQPEDLEHDDTSNLKLEVVDRKFRGTNFIYTLKTPSNTLIPVFVHSHHIHQHEVDEKFGVKRPIHIDHIVCF